MSVRQRSQPLVDLISRTSSQTYVCRQCRQTLKLQSITPLQARHASSAGPNSHRSKRLREYKQPVKYPLLADENPGKNIKSIAQPTKTQYDENGNIVFASNWRNLKVIPAYTDAKQLPNRREDVYEPWHVSSTEPLSQDHIVAYLFQAISECRACEISGISPNKFAGTSRARRVLSHEYLGAVSISQSINNNITDLGQPQLDETALKALKSQEEQADPAQDLYTPSESQMAFLKLRVEVYACSDVMFSILKRFSFLSGRRIPDPVLLKVGGMDATFQDLADQLYEHLKSKPANIAETLAVNNELLGQANVLVFPRKESEIDKEKEVGRWKVIKEELKKRSLPLYT